MKKIFINIFVFFFIPVIAFAIESDKITSREVFEKIIKLESKLDHKFEAVYQKFEAIDQRFEAIDQRFEAVDQKFEDIKSTINKEISVVHRRIDDLKDSINQRFADQNKVINQRFADQGQRFADQNEVINQRLADQTKVIDQRLADQNQRVTDQNELIKQQFQMTLWIVGILVAILGAILGYIIRRMSEMQNNIDTLPNKILLMIRENNITEKAELIEKTDEIDEKVAEQVHDQNKAIISLTETVEIMKASLESVITHLKKISDFEVILPGSPRPV